MKTFLKVLESIVAVPIGILGDICIIPFVAIALIVDLPFMIVQDIWDETEVYIDEQ